jgi:hypothetical protein
MVSHRHGPSPALVGLLAALFVFCIALLILTAGCATPYPGKPTPAAGGPVDGAPAIGNVYWSEAPDTRTPIEAFPWCADSQGHAEHYPCKWDTRERPAVGWDAQAAPVAVFVNRAVGCGPLIGRIRTAEDLHAVVAWACYYAPGG